MGYILSFDAISQVAAELGHSNKIVYTHGCYDLFHNGHLEFLRLSKQEGQLLIVGVEPDEVISAYKGIVRPVIPLKERINIISKLNYVDFAFPFEYRPSLISKITKNDLHYYHLNLYRILNPSVVTFGNMYSGVRTIDNAKMKMKRTKFKKIIHQYSNLQSTTAIIDKILSSK